MILTMRGRTIEFPRRPLVMGIVNINDDSFAGDGSLEIERAVATAQRHVFFGADFIDVGGESLLLVRGADGELRGFYNVCRHRGSRLCDPETHGHAKGAIKCPYHAWSYAYDGRLIGTPLVGKDELDRASFGLWQ